MIPITPDLLVQPLASEDAVLIADIVNRACQQAAYDVWLDNAAIQEQLYANRPTTLFPVRWQRHQRLCAWRAGQIEGFIDIATGLDSESLDRPDYQPIGILRFLILPDKAALLSEVATALLYAAEDFWRSAGIGYIKAFHKSTGYPNFQAGLGALPGHWGEHIRVLTGVDYHLCEKYYSLMRMLDQPVEETLPLAGISLLIRENGSERSYQLYRRADLMGTARVSSLMVQGVDRALRTANLLDLQVDPQWRGMDLGKWLLRRIVNDATLLGYQQMLVHVPHNAFAALRLLAQLGFEEQNYRAYTLEKTLTK